MLVLYIYDVAFMIYNLSSYRRMRVCVCVYVLVLQHCDEVT